MEKSIIIAIGALALALGAAFFIYMAVPVSADPMEMEHTAQAQMSALSMDSSDSVEISLGRLRAATYDGMSLVMEPVLSFPGGALKSEIEGKMALLKEAALNFAASRKKAELADEGAAAYSLEQHLNALLTGGSLYGVSWAVYEWNPLEEP